MAAFFRYGGIMSTIKTTGTALESSARSLFIGLLWGAAMLFVFGFWMRAKYDATQQVRAYIFYGLGALGLALAAWQAFTLWIQNVPLDQKTANLSQQRRLLSFALMAGGLALIVLSFVLGITKKAGGSYGFNLENFGESIGALLFGVITLAAGYLLQREPQDHPVGSISMLADKQPILKLLMLLLGLASIGGFGYFAFYEFVRQTPMASLAEIAALLLFSMLCFACFLWLNTGVMDETDIRMFVIIFGGSTGVILFMLALGRAIIWRDDVFFGSLAAWQGEHGYRVWVCAYLTFASLVLMFISFNLARADIRTNKTMRLLMYGFDTLAQLLLLLGILASLNIVVKAMAPFTYDWTKSRGAYALAESSKKLIGGLKEETHIIALVTQSSNSYADLRLLLDNCKALSNRLKVEFVSPDLNSLEYEKLAKLFPKIKAQSRPGFAGRGVLIVAGALPEKENHGVPYEFVPEDKLFKFQQGQQGAGNKTIFKGESEILTELKFLRQESSSRKIYVLQGHDEPGLTKQDPTERNDFRQGFGAVSISLFVERLKADRYDVSGLSFEEELLEKKTPNLVYAKEDAVGKRKEVPKDCKTLIIAGVSKPMSSEVIEAVDNYVERGGKLMVFLDVMVTTDYAKFKDTGIESMLKRFGVEVKNEFPLRLMRETRDDPRVLFATGAPDSTTPMARQFATDDEVIFMKRTARVVAPSSQPGGRFKAEAILHLDPEQWPTVNEKNVSVLQEPQRYMIELQQNKPRLRQAINQQAVPVAVAVRDTAGDKPCLVVFGDTEFITNREMAMSQSKQEAYSFAASSLDWLADREDLSGAPPNIRETYSLKPAAISNWPRMVLLPGWIMLLFIISLGVTVWVVRRR
jgi:hypothetical protein